MELRQLLGSHLRPYRRILAAVVLFQAVQTYATLTLPSINADIIDKGVLAGDQGEIWRLGGIMLAYTLLQIVFAVMAVWFGARAAMSFGRDVRRDLFHRVTDFSAREVGHFGAPSLITRITNDVQQVQMLVAMAGTMMLAAPLTFTIGIILAVRVDRGLSIVLVVALPIAAVALGSVVRRMVPAFERMQIRIDRVNQVLREQITGVRVVRAFVREDRESQRFAEANQALTDTSLQTGRMFAFIFPTVNLIINGSSIAVVWIGANRIGSGSMEPGALLAYLTYLIQIMMSVVMAAFMLSMIPRAGVAAQRIQEVLTTEPTVTGSHDPVTTVSERATLEFVDVGFHYPGAEHAVLSDISFRVEPGEFAAVIGSTGAGKTTLVNLVPRLFDATSGSVVVDGVDVRELDPELLWTRIGYVPQRAYLFGGTVASNLRFGRPDATDDELWEALEIAQAADFVREMPAGLDSRITQGGTNVSGGQRQRLAIARALVVRPEIYVFDDSFSALDTATEARLRAALMPRLADAAMLVVAQRVSTIVEAQLILVLDDGEIIGKGTHAELLESCPTYAEIVESQLGEGALA